MDDETESIDDFSSRSMGDLEMAGMEEVLSGPPSDDAPSSAKRPRCGPTPTHEVLEHFGNDQKNDKSVCKTMTKGKTCGQVLKGLKPGSCEYHLKSRHNEKAMISDFGAFVHTPYVSELPPPPFLHNYPKKKEDVLKCNGIIPSRVTFQRWAKGNVVIAECEPDGKYIILENSHRSKEESLDEWKLKRNLDGKEEVVFTFPSKYMLKPGKTVKIWARGQGGTHSPPDQLVYEGDDSWGVGQKVQTILYNKDGEEKSGHTQRSIPQETAST